MEDLIAALSAAAPRQVHTISRVLADAGEKAWIVGGCVRDVMLGLLTPKQAVSASDWDLATTAHPEKVQTLFRHVIPTGLEHGTVTIVLSKQHFEVTTLRGEKGHSDGRRPDEVYFVADLNEDLARRDFTVNAMAFDLEAKTFHDPYGGRDDLEHGLLRAVGKPLERFSEDGLRVLRCARFTATLRFQIEEQTAQAIRPSLKSFEKVAQERVRDEWFKALASETPSKFLRAIREHGMLSITAPFLFVSGEETIVAFKRATELCDQSPPDPIFRLALLLVFAIRVPRDPSAPEGEPTATAKTLGKRLRLSSDQLARLSHLIGYHRLPQELLVSGEGGAARRYLSQIGREHLSDVLSFQRHLGLEASDNAEAARQALEREAQSNCALSLRELAVSGTDLIERGVPKGPQVGQTLRLLLDIVLEEPGKNERERLLETLATLR